MDPMTEQQVRARLIELSVTKLLDVLIPLDDGIIADMESEEDIEKFASALVTLGTVSMIYESKKLIPFETVRAIEVPTSKSDREIALKVQSEFLYSNGDMYTL